MYVPEIISIKYSMSFKVMEGNQEETKHEMRQLEQTKIGHTKVLTQIKLWKD